MKSGKVMFGSLSIIFVILLMCWVEFSMFMSFAWGSPNDFSSRIIFPVLSVAIIVAIFSAIRLINDIHKTGAYSNKKILATFIISFLTPLILIILYSTLPPIQKVTYLEGMSPKACATGHSFVPWGKFSFEQNWCYSIHGMCNNIKPSNSGDFYYYYRQCVRNHPTEFYNDYKELDQIPGISNSQIKNRLLVELAQKKKDYNFCQNMPGWTGTITPDDHVVCLMTVTEINRPHGIDGCKKMSGVQADTCYALSAGDFLGPNISSCDYISNELTWLKNTCRMLYPKNAIIISSVDKKNVINFGNQINFAVIKILSNIGDNNLGTLSITDQSDVKVKNIKIISNGVTFLPVSSVSLSNQYIKNGIQYEFNFGKGGLILKNNMPVLINIIADIPKEAVDKNVYMMMSGAGGSGLVEGIGSTLISAVAK